MIPIIVKLKEPKNVASHRPIESRAADEKYGIPELIVKNK